MCLITVGKTVHFRKNNVTSPEPGSMLAGKPFAVAISYPHYPLGISENNVDNIVEDNEIEDDEDDDDSD